MTLEGRPVVPSPMHEIRARAREQSRALSGAVIAVAGGAVALLAVLAFVLLDYQFGQDTHRIVKVFLGASVVAGIVVAPRFGLFLFPLATPFLAWMPKVPIPGLNPLNALLLTLFFSFALGRVLQRQPIFRRGRLGGLIIGLLAVAAVSIVRGAAFPTGYEYDAAATSVVLFRSATAFASYFICLAMMSGAKDRRLMATMVIVGMVAEAVVTIVYGQTGRGGRAVGSFGQANELGAFLAMFTAFTASMIMAFRNWFVRLALLAAVGAGTMAVFLTVSRGAVLALGLALLIVAVRSSRLLTIVVLAVVISGPFWIPQDVKDRFLTTQEEVEGADELVLEGSAQLRVDTWQSLLRVISEHPLDGVGFAGLTYVLDMTDSALDSAHNTYLRILAEMGILGISLFCLLLWGCLRLSERGIRAAAGRFDRQLSLGLQAATVALAVSCMFGDRFFSILIAGNFWTVCALVDDLLLERGQIAGVAEARKR